MYPQIGDSTPRSHMVGVRSEWTIFWTGKNKLRNSKTFRHYSDAYVASHKITIVFENNTPYLISECLQNIFSKIIEKYMVA